MSWPVTRPNLRERIRKFADVVSETDRHPNSELNGYISDAIAELWDKIVEKNKDYRLSQIDVSISAGVATYPLQGDCYKVRTVLLTDNGVSRPLEHFLLQDIDHTSGSTIGSNTSLRFRSVGSDLFFDRLPQSDGTIRVYYTPTAPQYSDDVGTIDFINGWDKYVVFKAAGDIDLIDGRSSAQARYQAAEAQLARIRNAANTRDGGEPERVLRRDINIPWYIRTR